MSDTSLHEWEATGVSAYPITHPIVGQSDFYRKLKSYLQLVSGQGNRFAQVFAVVAPWGVGKSRLGYEIVAQVNGTSSGWKVWGESGRLEDARLFDSEAERCKHLALYIRYSQVAHEQLNLDNWFAPGLYKALLPLAADRFDTSIQHQIAREASARLQAQGFDPARLAAALELGQHNDDAVYGDTALATRLCSAAYEVLAEAGVEYVVVVLDELETAAERATQGLELEEARAMDGRAITMLRKAVETLGQREIEAMGKAVKEEDARARFPWLRFVALCSPAIGDELKDVQSTDRRFELVDLARNAFSDVSAFVASLEAEGRLLRSYPRGLVEAAYMMSGGNFGWFNVTMAVVDQALRRLPAGREPRLAEVFERVIEASNRIQRHVLDHRCVEEIGLAGDLRDAAAELLFGQQPVPVAQLGEATAQALLAARSAQGEPVAMRYQMVEWRYAECANTLVQSRFSRQAGTGTWVAPGIPEALDLERLLADLATLAVHEAQPTEPRRYVLLIPETLPELLQLLDLVHPHPAAEEVGRALWAALVGDGPGGTGLPTHIGPSVEMLRRLDIRLRRAATGALFRAPAENEAYERAAKRAVSRQEHQTAVLTGAMRLLDESWAYDAEPAGLADGLVAVRTSAAGLVDLKGLWLHPKGTAVLAWVGGEEELLRLAEAVAPLHRSEGRFPVVAFTSDYALPERFQASRRAELVKARDFVLVVHLNSAEESALASIGLPTAAAQGFRLRREGLTTRFAERLNRVKAPVLSRLRSWRRELHERGAIAWPLRPGGTLKDDAFATLVEGWKVVMLGQGGRSLGEVGPVGGLDHAGLAQVIGTLGLSPMAAPRGYGSDETSGLWVGEGEQARPEVPPFLLRAVVLWLLDHPGKGLDLAAVKPDWLWGYTWDGSRPTDIFREWFAIAVGLGWAVANEESKGKVSYTLLPRTALEGDLNAAKNWLDSTYKQVVRKLTDIVGPGAVDQWLAPPNGSKYLAALKTLADAERDLKALAALEANRPSSEDLAGLRTWFVDATRLRLRVRAGVDRVFVKSRYDGLKPDFAERVLKLDDEGRPLWERIRQADHFASAVEDMARRVRKRLPTLMEELRGKATALEGFPVELFTRPLAKIDGIVDPGLAGADPATSTQRAQQAQPDTLAYFLKELRVADALRALEEVARETGTHREASEDRPFETVEGEIVTAFRALRDEFEALKGTLASQGVRVSRLELALEDPPDDLVLPVEVALDQVAGRPRLIEESLTAGAEEMVEELLERHDEAMKRGRFGAVMREASARLLQEAEGAVKALEGRLRTLENVVGDYRRRLVERDEVAAAREAFNVLRRARGKDEVPPLRGSDLEQLSLRDGLARVLGLAQSWAQEGGAILAPTGVAFADWVVVVGAVRAGTAPAVDSAALDALVRESLLRRVYALPGGAE